MFLEMTDDDVTAPSSEWHLATLFSVNTHTWSWCFKHIETERDRQEHGEHELFRCLGLCMYVPKHQGSQGKLNENRKTGVYVEEPAEFNIVIRNCFMNDMCGYQINYRLNYGGNIYLKL